MAKQSLTLRGLNKSDNVLKQLEHGHKALTLGGTLILRYPNPLQQTFNPKAGPNWLPPETMSTLLTQAGFSAIEHGWYFGIPRSPVAKRFSRTFLARLISPTIYFKAIKSQLPKTKQYSVSVVIPCKDEEGNIARAIRSVPKIGHSTEIVVVDDGSRDHTAAITRELQKKFSNLKLVSYQVNRGKSHALKRGFTAARGDIVMIWDADMTVPASELPRFIEPIARGIASFTNGTRFIYPMETKAMKRTNFVGNKLMSVLFSWILGQHITDTLCGTKTLFKRDWQKMEWGGDPWGDFSLLLGASKFGLKIQDVPVHYLARTAGASKMKTIQHGFYLLKAALKGFIELKLRGRRNLRKTYITLT